MTFALVTAAVGIGSMHTLAPDHWMPFAALARAERWSTWRTMLITSLCGVGHVTVSVTLGLTSALFGLELLETFGRRLESIAGFLLIGFGVAYGLWGVHRSVRARWHDHDQIDPPIERRDQRGRRARDPLPTLRALRLTSCSHPHWHGGHVGHGHRTAHHVHADPHEGRLTAWTLFLLFSADPCVAVIPLMFLAAPLGWASTLAIVASYELATIGTMVALVWPARAAATAVRGQWADRYGDALAGGVIAALGIAVVGLGK